jgi:hypothetical protein
VIVYLWTAVARDTAVPRSSLGISDDDRHAREAAEQCLHAGEARLAFVEAARSAIAGLGFTHTYLPTGAGWWATPAPAGQVHWVRFTGTDTSAALRTLAGSAEPEDRDG